MDTNLATTRELPLKDAKAGLSAVVNEAIGGTASIITRHGKPAAVILGYEEYQRLLKAAPSFAQLLLAFPLGKEDAHLFERDQTPWEPHEF